MARLANGSFRVGRILGVDLYVHWSWAVVAAIEIGTRKNTYSAQAWMVAEYLSLFAIILAHELGHALACRSVGGKADRILLWPLGGVAYVQPPPRPGALLWSIAAGPLVNVALVLFLSPIALVAGLQLHGDAGHFVVALWVINVVLLAFNLLPVYPLDGGQILQALLWFLIGRARSLLVVSVIGLAGAGALLVAAAASRSIWLGVLAIFAGLRARNGLRQARLLADLAAAPRRQGVACPRCHAAPPVGTFWLCACGQRFDTFATRGTCGHCGRVYAATSCTECHQSSPHAAFYPPVPEPAPAPATTAATQTA
jgi:Zn-dependent protease